MNILEARRRTLAAEVYKKTAEGNPVSVRSLARMRPGLNVYGKSTQQTTTGAQLLDLQDSETSSSGISYIVKDGAITATGTATNTAVAAEKKISLQNGTYYVSGKNGNLIFWIRISYSDDKPVAYFNNTSFNVDDTAAEIIAYAQVDKGKTVNNAVMYPMLNAGSFALPWEPYTGGHPSPSADYPQEISSAGDDGSIEVDVTGAQLLDAVNTADADLTVNGVTITNNSDGSFTISGTPTNTGGYVCAYYVAREMVLEDGQYVITNVSGISITKKDGSIVYTNLFFTFDSETDESINVYIQRSLENYIDGETVWPMLNKGSAALPWEPYKQPQSLTVQTPNGLPGIPVTSGGNYTDENGQQWICDEIDFKRGKYVKRVAKYVPAEQMQHITNGGAQDTSNTILCRFYTKIKPNPNVGCAQNNFVSKVHSDIWNADEECWNFQSDGSLDFRINKDRLTEVTFEAAKQFCSEIGAYFYYALGAPIETNLAEEQMQAYVNLHTNRPTTIVSATDGAGLRLTYKTKKSLEVT